MLKAENKLIESARTGNNRLWTYLVVLVMVLILQTAWSTLLILPLALVYGTLDLAQIPQLPLLAVSLLSFAGILAGLWLGLRLIHRRGFSTLFGPPRRYRWKLFLVSGGLWVGLNAAADLLLARLQPGNYTWNFDPAQFWPYLLAALLLFPLQVAAEELLFRAYLTQAVGIKTRSTLLALIVPALIFGLMHGANPEVGTYGWMWMLPMYIGMGLVLGWVTLDSLGLEAALGMHLANNLYAGLVVTMASTALPAPALFSIQKYDPTAGLGMFILASASYLALFKLYQRRRLAQAALLGVLLLTGCAPARTTDPENASIQLSDCLLTAEGIPIRVSARCASLEVAEDPANPGGRKINLNIAVVKAQSSDPAPDPVFLLAGGPGQAATEAYLGTIGSLEKIGFKHDLVLVDQRGTGKSNPLTCDEASQGELPIGRQTKPDETAAIYRACLQQWDADPRFYTTAYFASDLEAVRLALGYGQIDLLGISYGTRAAMAYLKTYPQSVRAFVLDGVVPPTWVLGQSVDSDAARAMELILARCQSEHGCGQAFPDLRGDLDRLLLRLKNQTETVTIPDPTSGADLQVEVNDRTAAAMLRLISYSSDYTTLIPVLIHTAAAGDLRPLAAQYAITERRSGGLYGGLYYAVVCSEDVPFLTAGATSDGLYTFDAVETMRAVCSVFPANPQPKSERSFLPLDTPGLIISGEADPVTPPANGDAAARLLPNAKHIVLNGMGHSNVTAGCLPNLIRQLFEDGSSENIDPACAQRVAPAPLFTSLIGPEP